MKDFKMKKLLLMLLLTVCTNIIWAQSEVDELVNTFEPWRTDTTPGKVRRVDFMHLLGAEPGSDFELRGLEKSSVLGILGQPDEQTTKSFVYHIGKEADDQNSSYYSIYIIFFRGRAKGTKVVISNCG